MLIKWLKKEMKMENLNIEFTSSITSDFIANQTLDKPINNQVFTPCQIAQYMANMTRFPQGNFSIIDPGAGTGILIAAICDRIYNENKSPVEILITAYENDEKIIPYLKKSLTYCKSTLEEKKNTLNFKILNSDFILESQKYLNLDHSLSLEKLNKYDIVISNPPYQKINHKSSFIKYFSPYLHGQTNSYALFIALSLRMLKNGGIFTFLTPRSFFSGPYHYKIRKWMLQNCCLTNVHLFKSRKDIFESHNIKQELIIFNGTKWDKPKCNPLLISLSDNKNLGNVRKLEVLYDVVSPKNDSEINIHIPENENDIKIIELIHSWDNTLNDYGIFASTGKVVDFRSTHFINANSSDSDMVPLLWMHHVRKNHINWPLPEFKKPQRIKFCEDSFKRLVPNQNYVLIRRFSSKDEKSRIISAPLFQKQFKSFQYLGFENHLNYVYKKDDLLTVEEVQGISIFFNSLIVDRYYRSLGGSTQVNATDINNLNIPKIDKIIQIGEFFSKRKNQNNNLDIEIAKILNLDLKLVNSVINCNPYK